jgi:hypothetical protein
MRSGNAAWGRASCCQSGGEAPLAAFRAHRFALLTLQQLWGEPAKLVEHDTRHYPDVPRWV